MTRLTNKDRSTARIFLGVWEEEWQGRAEQEQKAERYRTWLCSQGASRDRASEWAVRTLAKERQPEPLL
jgi:hypothetical protein